MKATGIVRRIDDLGRIVIPKEIRRTLRLREGDPLEIFTDRECGIILKKYSPIEDLTKFATEYSDSLQHTIGNIILICDKYNIISVSGITKKEYLEKKISIDLEKVMEDRKSLIFGNAMGETIPLFENEEFDDKYSAQVISPILAEEEIIGAVIITSKEQNKKFSDIELKLAEAASLFLGMQQ